MAKSNLKVVSDVTNGGKSAIEQGFPYAVAVRAQGAADLLFHRWNCESVDAKSKAAKNSAAKKTDDIESYVWRNEKEPELIEPDLPCASDGKWIYSFRYSPLSISTPVFFKTY